MLRDSVVGTQYQAARPSASPGAESASGRARTVSAARGRKQQRGGGDPERRRPAQQRLGGLAAPRLHPLKTGAEWFSSDIKDQSEQLASSGCHVGFGC